MSIKNNLISNFILSSSSVIFPLLTFPYITRILNPESLGNIFFIEAIVSYCIIFSSIGIPYYGVREIAKLNKDFQSISRLVTELIVIQLTLALSFALILYIAHKFYTPLIANQNFVALGCLVIVSNAFLIEWFYQGIESFSFIAYRSLIVKTFSVISVFAFIRSTNDSFVYYVILSSVTVVNALYNYINFRIKYFIPSSKKLEIRRHLKPLFVLFSINVSISVYTILDTIILGLLSDPKNVSYYSVPLKLVKIFWILVGSIGIVLIPKISRFYKDNNIERISDLMTKSFNLVFLLTIPFCFFCITFSTEIITIISGTKYLLSINALRILSLVPFIIAVCNVLGSQFLLPIGMEREILVATIVGLVVSLALNILLIPYLSFLGSSIACVASESAVCIYIYMAAKNHIKIKIDYSILMHILTALFFTFVCSSFFGQYLHGVAILMLAVVAYIFSFIALQLFLFKNDFVYSLLKIKQL